jgi:cation diffusion facilitator family transporter
MMGTKQRYTSHAETAEAAGIWGNAGLALLKGAVGLFSGSAVLLADAFRSAADAAKYYLRISGLRETKEPLGTGADGDHRTAAAVSVVAAALFLLVGLEIGMSAVRDIVQGNQTVPHWSAMAAVILALIIKEWGFAEQDKRFDLLAAFIVLAGTGGAWLGGHWDLPFLSVLQPAAAVVIALIIMYNGYRFVVGSVSRSKRPERPQEEDAAELSKAVERIEGVITVDGLRAWEQGHYVAVDIRISVNPRITVLEGHEIGRRVKEHLLKRFLHISDVSIHVDPYDPGYPYRSNHDPNQEHIPTLLQ